MTLKMPGPLTWWVEDLHFVVDSDPDNMRACARKLMYTLDAMTKRGFDIRNILQVGRRDSGEEILFVCACKVRQQKQPDIKEPKTKPRRKKAVLEPLQAALVEHADAERAKRLADVLEKVALAKAKTNE